MTTVDLQSETKDEHHAVVDNHINGYLASGRVSLRINSPTQWFPTSSARLLAAALVAEADEADRREAAMRGRRP